MRIGLVVLGLLALCAAAPAQQHNVLLIIADDVGVDLVNAYHEAPGPLHTPVIDSLAAGGVLFRNAWADPSCSPTRAQMLTGRHGFRTGVGIPMNYDVDTYEVPLTEVSLAEVLAPTYHSAVAGKWHMSCKTVTGPLHPLLAGFEHDIGSMAIFPGFISNDYYSYDKAVDGTIVHSLVYATTDTVNDCLARIASYGSSRWFMWLAFNAPHAPFHKPPANLHTYSLPAQVSGNIPIHVQAATEAMDTEMGRLFASMSPAVLANTVIVFIGDNGTDKNAVLPPFIPAKAKGTVYEGGINVPLIVKGPGVVAGAECAALVSATDVFATVADLGGVPHPTATDSVSIVPYLTQPALPSLRSTVYAEYYLPNGYKTKDTWQRAVRDQRYKIIWNFDKVTQPVPVLQMFDLLTDPFETVNLLTGPLTQPQQDSLAALNAELASLSISWANVSPGLAGSFGFVPKLSGTGTPSAGNPVVITVDHVHPNSSAALVVGLTSIHKAFKGGLMGVAPDFIAPAFIGATGASNIPLVWPAGLPPGLSIFYQFWIQDPGGIQGWSASNTLASLSPM